MEIEKGIQEALQAVYLSLKDRDTLIFKDSVASLDEALVTACQELGFCYSNKVIIQNLPDSIGPWFSLAILSRFPALVEGVLDFSHEEFVRYLLRYNLELIEKVLSGESDEISFPLILAALYASRTVYGESLASKIIDKDNIVPDLLRITSEVNPIYKNCFFNNPVAGNIILFNLFQAMEVSANAEFKSVLLGAIQQSGAENTKFISLFSYLSDEITNIVFAQIAQSHLSSNSTEEDNRAIEFFEPATELRSTEGIVKALEKLWFVFRGKENYQIHNLINLGALFWEAFFIAVKISRKELFETEESDSIELSHTGRVFFNDILNGLQDKELQDLFIITKPYLIFDKHSVVGFFLSRDRKISSHTIGEQRYFSALVDLLKLSRKSALAIDEFLLLLGGMPMPCIDYYEFEDIVVDREVLGLSDEDLFKLPFLERGAIISALKEINLNVWSGSSGLFASYLCDYLYEYAPYLVPKVDIAYSQASPPPI